MGLSYNTQEVHERNAFFNDLWNRDSDPCRNKARKLALNWEGPYRITAMAGAKVYYFEHMEERPLP